MQFSGKLREFWVQGPLGSKLHWAPLTKILDTPLAKVPDCSSGPFQVLSDFGLIAPTSEMARLLATKPGTKVYLYHVSNQVSALLWPYACH